MIPQDKDKDRSQLLDELEALRHRVAELEVLEAERKESQEILRFLFESIGEGIIIIDLSGKVVEVNEAALRIHGCSSKEEVIGRDSLEFIAERDRTRAKEDIRKAIGEGRGARFEYTLLTKDGREVDTEASAILLNDSSGNP